MNKEFATLEELASFLRSRLDNRNLILLYAFNGTGKTRLSMEFKNKGKQGDTRDTLYFNAFTEDLFSWDNDIVNDVDRKLMLNRDSAFFRGLRELEMENRIRPFLNRYADFDFEIDYTGWSIRFYPANSSNWEENIKVSRGEENIFIWCFFLAIVQLALDPNIEAYNWVKFIYIDDPISSLDENNAIAVACHLVQLLNPETNSSIKAVISTHHTLFFNVLYNELGRGGYDKIFLHRKSQSGVYHIRETGDTSFMYHVAMLSKLKAIVDSGNLFPYHFNLLRSILEKTAVFFGYKNFKDCIQEFHDDNENKILFHRALQLLSHGQHSVYQPVMMLEDTKDIFERVLDGFLTRYHFELPDIFDESPTLPPDPS